MNIYLIIFLLVTFFIAIYFLKNKLLDLIFNPSTKKFDKTDKNNKKYKINTKSEYKELEINDCNLLDKNNKQKTGMTDSEKALFDDSISQNKSNSDKNNDTISINSESININELSFGTKSLDSDNFSKTSSLSEISKMSQISGISQISDISNVSDVSNLKKNKDKSNIGSNDSNFNSIDDIGTFDNISNISNISQLSKGSLQSQNSSITLN